MYLHTLQIRNLKLLRAVDLDLLRDGKPRMWTVLLGPNGVCKTSILQAIGMVASGAARSKQLANVSSLIDRRNPNEPMIVEATFGFSDDRDHHSYRTYPFLDPRPATPPFVRASVRLKKDQSDFEGWSSYGQEYPPELIDAVAKLFAQYGSTTGLPPDAAAKSKILHFAAHGFIDELQRLGVPLKDQGPLAQARSDRANLWFVAGYGVNRVIADVEYAEPDDFAVQRLESLFGRGSVIGTGFLDLFYKREMTEDSSATRPGRKPRHGSVEFTTEYNRILRQVLVESEHLLPLVADIEVRGQPVVRRTRDFMQSARFFFDAAHGKPPVAVPATSLSQGYQGMIAWVADLIGQILWEADGPIEPADMEGLVLLDEIDLHLHPRWQVVVVRTLRKVFPMMQFITTTHSPMILPYLRQDEVKLVQLDGEGNVVVKDVDQSPALMTASDIYATYFGLEEVFPNQLGEALWRYSYLASNPLRTEAEEREMPALRKSLTDADIDPGVRPVPRRQPR